MSLPVQNNIFLAECNQIEELSILQNSFKDVLT